MNSQRVDLSIQDALTFGKALICSLTFTPPVANRVLKVKTRFQSSAMNCSQENWVRVKDGVRNVTVPVCKGSRTDFTSLLHEVKVVVNVSEVKVVFSVSMTVEAAKPSLERGRVMENVDYIQSPGFTERYQYPRNMDILVKIAVPSGHVTLISFASMLTFTALKGSLQECQYHHADFIYLYQGPYSPNQQAVWEACYVTVPPPEVYTTSVLWRRSPSRGPGGLWNCSAKEWSEFQSHFDCNLERECEGGEDEDTCFYSGSCGPRYLTLHDRCYYYGRRESKGPTSSWRDSNRQCQTMEGYLASLNTPREWGSVMRALDLRRSRRAVFLGLQMAPSTLPRLYRQSQLWADKTIAYYVDTDVLHRHACGRLISTSRITIELWHSCQQSLHDTDFLCEMSDSVNQDQNRDVSDALMPLPVNQTLPVPFVKCPGGHLTHTLLACDVHVACYRDHDSGLDEASWGIPSVTSCPAPLASLPAMFRCGNGGQEVTYSMVCDHQDQCGDGSDESFCHFPDCAPHAPFRCGASRQCVSKSDLCNVKPDCIEASDEEFCTYDVVSHVSRQHQPPAIVDFTPYGQSFVHITPLRPPPTDRSNGQPSGGCPDTHVQCPGLVYCLPVFVRCNGVLDCPHQEDEADCQTYTCPGLYRCHQSRVCVHPSQVCDGVYQCPQRDDELFCSAPCPPHCACHGHAFRCPRPFLLQHFPFLRYLDGSGSGLMPQEGELCPLLVHLGLRRCGVQHLTNLSLPNLRSFDLSLNLIRVIRVKDLAGMQNLQRLALSGNPIKSLFSADLPSGPPPALLLLDVSLVPMKEIHLHTFSIFPHLQFLNFSQCGVVTVVGERFGSSGLTELDFTGCPMTHVPRELFQGLPQLRTVHADNFKLCCPRMLPDLFDAARCQAPQDGVSSCDALLRSDLFRVFLSLFSALSLMGNLGCFLVRTFCFHSAKSGFAVFVTHLSGADFLMGVYLAVIGVADRVYLGSYLWEAESWRRSAACQAAGFLCLVSTEVSAVLICLITMDRLLALAFPFRQLCFQPRSARVACLLVWTLWALLAALPLMPPTRHWALYSQTGICMPLPISSPSHAGHHFAFAVIIVFNFILFLLIAVGQLLIYMSVRANTLKDTDASSSSSSQKSHDVQIARRLLTVVLSDFLCWFPVGLMGLLASQGHALPGQVNVTVAIFVMPLNSALNPFLYTLNVVLQYRQRHRDEQLMKDMMAYIREHPEVN
ncbi:hypothetical protein ACOMHN_025506 [Nucella lapillus]